MAKIVRRTDIDDLVIRARMDTDGLGQLYELYYTLNAIRYLRLKNLSSPASIHSRMLSTQSPQLDL